MSRVALRERLTRPMDSAPSRSGKDRRRWRIVPVAIGACVVILVALTGKLFIWPSPTSSPKRADAVLVIPGGGGDRLRRALTLMTAHVAPVLIIPNGATQSWPEANRLCASTQPYKVQCPMLRGQSVRADAELIREVERRNRWGYVVVVTSRYNLTRARMDFDRCVGAGFAMVSSNSNEAPWTKTHHVVDEWVSWVQDGVLHRSC